jgi:hypothetical protein
LFFTLYRDSNPHPFLGPVRMRLPVPPS